MINTVMVLSTILVFFGIIAGQIWLFLNIQTLKQKFNDMIDRHVEMADIMREYTLFQKNKTDAMIKDTENLSASVTRRTDSLAAQINDVKEKIGVGNELA